MDGGQTVTISRSDELQGATWGEDGTIVYSTFGRGAMLYEVADQGGEPETLTGLAEGDVRHQDPWFLPGSRSLLYVAQRPEETAIMALDLDRGVTRDLGLRGSIPRYVEPGLLVYVSSYSDGVVQSVRFDAEKLEVLGEPVRLPQTVAMRRYNTPRIAFSRNGHMAYYETAGENSIGASEVWWFDPSDGSMEKTEIPPADNSYLRLSPDGSRVAMDVRSGERDIWTWDLERRTASRLTFFASRDEYPAWSPDGRRLYFASIRTGTVAMFSMPSDGSGEAVEVAGIEGDQYSISPDGETVIFRGNYYETGPASSIWMASLVGDAEPRPLLQSDFVQRNAEISPDGRWMVYQSEESGEFEIYVRPFPDVNSGRWQLSSSGGSEPFWSRDQRWIYYVSRRDRHLFRLPVSVEGDAFVPGRLEDLGEVPFDLSGQGRNLDIHPDGRILGPVPIGDDNSGRLVLVTNWVEEFPALRSPGSR